MSGPIFSPPGPWANYHSTVVQRSDQIRVRLARTPSPAPNWAWPDVLARCIAVQQLLSVPKLQQPLISLGAGWSLSGLLDARTPSGMGVLLETGSLAGAMAWPNLDAGRQQLVLAGGGSTIRQLCDWLEPRGLMLRSAGSHDGATLAGACATGTHGSWLGEGGVASQIVALLLVTGTGNPVWLTPDKGMKPLQGGIQHIASTATFLTARTHLGAMGVVVAALIRPQKLRYFRVYRDENRLPPNWPAVMATANLATWGQTLLNAASPLAYFELDFDPQQPDQNVLTGLAPERSKPLIDPDPLASPGALDALGWGSLQRGALPPVYHSYVTLLRQSGQIGPGTSSLLPPTTLGGFVQRHERLVPQLYSGGLAFERQQLPAMMAALGKVVRGLPPHFICALRPVSGQGGALDFCGWSESLVLNIDGYGALVDPTDASATLMDRLCAQMVADGIPHRLHWGKQGPFSLARLAADYGAAIPAWQAIRSQLKVDPRFNLPWLASLGLV